MSEVGPSSEGQGWKAPVEALVDHEQVEKAIERLGILDVSPEHPKTEVPVIIAPGYAETTVTFAEVAKVMAGCDRRVISFNHPRHGELSEVDENRYADIADKVYPRAAYQRALNLLAVIAEQQPEGKVDVVAHSQGGVDVMIAAQLEPERFRNIILVDSGGLIGPDTFPRVSGRFMQNVPGTPFAQQREGAKYLFSNPARAVAEGIGASRAQIDEVLEIVHGFGIGIGVIHAVDDKLMPQDRVQKTLTPKAPNQLPISETHLDGYLSVKGSHVEWLNQPERYTRAIDALMTAIERRPRTG